MMLLLQCADAFSWQHHSVELGVLHAVYVAKLMSRLEPALDVVNSSLGTDSIDTWPSVELTSFVCTPEVSFRLLWPNHHEPEKAQVFLAEAAAAYLATHLRRKSASLVWSPGGDRWIEPGMEVVVPWPSSHGLTIDAGSPYALSIDVSGERHRRQSMSSPLSLCSTRQALDKVEHAAQAISTNQPHVWRVVSQFTKALLLLPDDQAPQSFASGSSGQFVGRSVLSNPHLPSVDVCQVADALVHEAIHSVLYMDEQLDPWVLRPELYAGPLRIRSPWSGNLLPLRPYLQANFVWYGLLAFWSSAINDLAFPRHQSRELLCKALLGFLRGPVLAPVSAIQSDLNPEVLTAIERMQENALMLSKDLGLQRRAS